MVTGAGNMQRGGGDEPSAVPPSGSGSNYGSGSGSGAGAGAAPPAEAPTPARTRALPTFWAVFVALTGIAAASTIVYKVFGIGISVGFIPIEATYFYVAFALLVPPVFLLFPATRGAPMDRVPLYDVVLFLVCAAAAWTFATDTRTIIGYGWEFAAPEWATWVALLLWLLTIEATRRAAGLAVAGVIAVGSFYPVFGGADWLGPFQVNPVSLTDTAAFHMFGGESIIGIPLRAMVNIVLGFLLFGAALQHTGAGRFFLDMSFALLGHTRGGPAKVAVLASGFMGSISGSAVTNVVTTGVLTIPTMKRIGFPPAKAGGVEACASTGGVLMPPVMGATAFIMATYLEISYQTIAVAAIIPSFLYFFGLFVQIDAFAARRGLTGLPREELPRIGAVLKAGWYYLGVLIVLVWLLFYLKQESLAPFYATATLIAINQALPGNRWGWTEVKAFVHDASVLFIEIGTILAGVGLLMGALVLTGKVGSIAYDLVGFAGDSVLLLLVMGAIASMILGMGMTITAAYLFLAIALAPALTDSGLNLLAVHLFMLYWAMISYVTPPVAFAAFAAAPIAGSSAMRTGFEAMRMASVIYFIPFFFVLNPAMIGQGTAAEVGTVVVTASVGVVMLAGALQGYVLGIGRLGGRGALDMLVRALAFVAGIMFLAPGGERFGLSSLQLALVGLALFGAALLIARLARRAGGRAAAGTAAST